MGTEIGTEPRGECWFCKGSFVVDALIAGYDTFEESRLACLACNERMSGNWRAARSSTPLDDGPTPGLCDNATPHGPHTRSEEESCPGVPAPLDDGGLDAARAGLWAEVEAEGYRALVMHGEPPDRDGRDWLAILAEEFGEVAMEVTKGEVPPVNRDRAEYLRLLRGELVQVASVAMRWLSAADRALAETLRNRG